jgi:hypothetical protein
MDIEIYLDHLSECLVEIQDIIHNIEYCGMDNDDKNEILLVLNEKYLKIHTVFQQNILTYCSA